MPDFPKPIILFDFPGPRLRSFTVSCINIITLYALDNKKESALLENQSSSINMHKQCILMRGTIYVETPRLELGRDMGAKTKKCGEILVYKQMPSTVDLLDYMEKARLALVVGYALQEG